MEINNKYIFNNKYDLVNYLLYKLNEELTLSEKNNIIKFIDNIINQTDELDDYSLMDRTREDKVWSDSYKNKEKNMNPYLIVDEYYTNE